MQKRLQLNIWSTVRGIFVRRNYKDFLFSRVFRDKEDLLDLYNALHGTTYDNPNELEITTFEDAIYLSIKNDVSFIISSTLNLYEHQSTINPNMPLRGLLYLAKSYEAYIKTNKLNVFGRAPIKLPRPQFIVFYNGKDYQPDEQILRLSDSFMTSEAFSDIMLECQARILNINYGHNKTLLDTCKRLHDYSYFINKVNENLDHGMARKDSIELAIDECIEKDVLSDILEKHRSEVYDMLLTRDDVKLHEKTLRAEGLADLRQLIVLLLEDGRDEDIRKLASDDEYLRQLLKEYNLEDDSSYII